VSEAPINISILFDMTQADAQLRDMQNKIDAQEQAWRQKRLELIREIQHVSHAINMLYQGLHIVVTVAGDALNPFFAALASVISSTVSLMLTTAAAITAGSMGTLAYIGAALSAAAIGISLGVAVRNEEMRKMTMSQIDRIRERVAMAQWTEQITRRYL